ncbi:hypothetical protein EVAR_71400_1 [Eumeta japonica]|uniref:Uncharacterized protein n=1 Tax=Eumeta variegata TaxID=151549 RepID=A0A4C2A6K6_EUMVA|nr:hypothetical protein EVAR_71400_1 [Eumeta japonica]
MSIVWMLGNKEITANERTKSLASRTIDLSNISLICEKPFDTVEFELTGITKPLESVQEFHVGSGKRKRREMPELHMQNDWICLGHSQLLARLNRIGVTRR